MKARKLFLLLEVAIAAPLLVAGVNLGLFLAGIEVDIPSADLVDQRVVTYDAASNTLKLVTAPGGGAGDVTAGANLANNGVVTGDGGAKGVKTDSVATLVAGLFTTANVSATDAGVTSPSVFVTGGGNDDPDLVVTGDGTVSGLFTTANVSATDAGVTSPSIFVTGGGNSDPDLVVTGDADISGNTSITGGISGAFVTGSIIEPSGYVRTPKVKFTDGTEMTTAAVSSFSGDVSTTVDGFLSDSAGPLPISSNTSITAQVSAETLELAPTTGYALEVHPGTRQGIHTVDVGNVFDNSSAGGLPAAVTMTGAFGTSNSNYTPAFYASIVNNLSQTFYFYMGRAENEPQVLTNTRIAWPGQSRISGVSWLGSALGISFAIIPNDNLNLDSVSGTGEINCNMTIDMLSASRDIRMAGGDIFDDTGSLLLADDVEVTGDVTVTRTMSSGSVLSYSTAMVPVTLFVAVEDSTAIASTTTETPFDNIGLVLKADTLGVSTTYRYSAWGSVGSTATPNITLDLDFEGVDLATATFTAITSPDWVVDGLITVRGSGGSAPTRGYLHGDVGTISGIGTTDATVDTSVENEVHLTAEWSAADALNTITCKGFVFEAVRP